MIDHVLPLVPFRQWVLSVPKRVRWHLREKPEVISGLLGVFNRDTGCGAEFHPAFELDSADFQAVQRKIRKRGLRWLHRHGHLDSTAVHVLDAADHADGWTVDPSVTIRGWEPRGGIVRLDCSSAQTRSTILPKSASNSRLYIRLANPSVIPAR